MDFCTLEELDDGMHFWTINRSTSAFKDFYSFRVVGIRGTPGGDAPGRTLRLPPGSMKQRHVVQDAGVDLGRHWRAGVPSRKLR